MSINPLAPPIMPSPALPAYPAKLTVDYPERPLSRLTSIFRIFMIIPIYIILALLSNSVFNWDSRQQMDNGWRAWSMGGGAVVLPLVLMILFRQKYPRWWFDWNLNFTRFGYRVGSYFALLRDEYPSTDEEQAVHVDLVYPDAQRDLRRGMPLIKWFLAIPHWIILGFLWIAAWVCIIVAWFAIIFTARYPKGLFDFVVGVFRWTLRVEAYAFLLTTDRYPPFSLTD